MGRSFGEVIGSPGCAHERISLLVSLQLGVIWEVKPGGGLEFYLPSSSQDHCLLPALPAVPLCQVPMPWSLLVPN